MKKKTTSKYLEENILFIGNEIPDFLPFDDRDKFIVLGTPQRMIDETVNPINGNKSEFEIACWIAEYAYKMANPKGEFSEPPSMVYEQVSRDFSNFLSK